MNVTQIAAVHLIVSAIIFAANMGSKVSFLGLLFMLVVFAVCALRDGEK